MSLSASTAISNDISSLSTTASLAPTSKMPNLSDGIMYNHHFSVVNNKTTAQLSNTAHINSVVIDKSSNLFQSDNGN